MRSAFRGPAHQLAVRMRINNMAIIIIMAQATSHAPCASNCTCAEGFIIFAVMKSVVTLLDSSFCQAEMQDCKK